MKNMWKYAMLLVAAAGCFACEDPEVGETLPDYYSKTFVTLQTSGTTDLIEAEVVNTPIGVVPRTEYNRQVIISLTRELDKDLTIELGADYSLVADRAAADGTDYQQLPVEACVPSSMSVVIPAGQREATVDLAIGDTSFASEVRKKEYYVLPWVITKVSDPSITISKQKQAAYCRVKTSYSQLHAVDSASKIPGSVISAGELTMNGGDNKIIDGNFSSYWRPGQQKGTVVTFELDAVRHTTGIVMKSDPFEVDIEYSLDGTTWYSGGRIDETSSYTSGDYTYTAFYGTVDARYMRLTFDAKNSNSYYWYLYEVQIYAVEFLEPYVYLSTTGVNNEIQASVIHLASGSTASVSGTLAAHVSDPSSSGYTAKFTVDNSLIAAYNAAHETNYQPLPAGMLTVADAPIAADATASEEIRPELTGDLASLTEPAYLVPLRISAGNLKVSERNGVAYVVIITETNQFIPAPTTSDIRGQQIDRSAFTATDTATGDPINGLFDGSTSSYDSTTDIVVNMGATYNVSALYMNFVYSRYSYYSPIKMRISTSSDGKNWTVCGTVTSEFWNKSSDNHLMVLGASVTCQYLRLELLETNPYYVYYGLSEFSVYAD